MAEIIEYTLHIARNNEIEQYITQIHQYDANITQLVEYDVTYITQNLGIYGYVQRNSLHEVEL